MGNRAVITTRYKNMGIYLHWNGGLESVLAFLEVCKQQGYRSPERDSYGWAALTGVITTFFNHTGMSCGIAPYQQLDTDNGDNGTYVIENWEVVERLYARNKTPRTQVEHLSKFARDGYPSQLETYEGMVKVITEKIEASRQVQV